MSELLPVAEAQARLFAANPPVATEIVPITQAIGRWVAAPILAERTQPAQDLSAMDGYALRWADMPGPWRVIGESAAGRPFAETVNEGEAVRIFTGAAMPDGADTVLVQEEAERDGERLILDGAGPPRKAANVRRKGLDFSSGDPLVAAGERLTAARIAVAATGGAREVTVRRRIRVAIAATGDELVEPGTGTSPDALPESNRLLLRALLADVPIEIIDLGILPDRQDVLTKAFATVDADLLVTTGGASVGDHDLVRAALLAAGASIDFWRVALRPGKPLMAGRRRDLAVLGLPGNPVSAFVTTLLFVKPLVAHLAGAHHPLPTTTRAILGEAIPPNGSRTDYMRAELRDGRAFVAAIQDSSMLLTLARAGCLIVRPAHDPARGCGEAAEILMIG